MFSSNYQIHIKRKRGKGRGEIEINKGEMIQGEREGGEIEKEKEGKERMRRCG